MMTSDVFRAVHGIMEADTKRRMLSSQVGGEVSSNCLPQHGRHPNYAFLLGAPTSRTTTDRCLVSVRSETPSIAEVPYLYWFTGRKWPSSIYHKALCEAASCEVVSTSEQQHSANATRGGVINHNRIRCFRYEIVGCPIVLERFQLPSSENSLCRMFCTKARTAEARVGGAMSHLAGASVTDIHHRFVAITGPMLLPEEGHREASWCTLTSALDDERSSESSSNATALSTNRPASASTMRSTPCDASSMGRSSTSSSTSYGSGVSTSDTPLTPPARGCSELSSTAGHSPEPVLLTEFAAVSGHHKSATSRTFILDMVRDLLARDELLVLHQMQQNCVDVMDTNSQEIFRAHAAAVTRGWDYWRAHSPADLQTLERRSVVNSIHEIMFSNSCSRNAYHLAVTLLDRYLAVTGELLSQVSLQASSPMTEQSLYLASLVRPPSGTSIRAAIACAISLASKCLDIYAPSLERLGMSLGREIFELSSSYETLETNFLCVLRFCVHPLTVEEVSESLLELWFGHSTQSHPCVGAPAPPMSLSARRAATLARYLVDLVVRTSIHTSLPPTYVAAAAVQYAVEAVRISEGLSASDMRPVDEALHVFMSALSDEPLANQCVEVLRRSHIAARARPVAFLETQYTNPISSADRARSCRTAFLEPLSISVIPPLLPVGKSEAEFLRYCRSTRTTTAALSEQ
jgi:hypothetical protein